MRVEFCYRIFGNKFWIIYVVFRENKLIFHNRAAHACDKLKKCVWEIFLKHKKSINWDIVYKRIVFQSTCFSLSDDVNIEIMQRLEINKFVKNIK